MEVSNDVLVHYGILGMKWGVRRTPEQLGHKAAVASSKLQKYKDKKTAKVEKMYAKSIRTIEDALEYDPGNKELTSQLNDLKKLRDKDLEGVKNMTYTDVVKEQKQLSQERKEKAAAIAKSTIKTAGGVALWGAKMGLVGVKIYGTVKAAQLVGEFASRGIAWVTGPEGQALMNNVFSAINKGVSVVDKAATIANPSLDMYLDTQKFADYAIDYGKTVAEEEIKKQLASMGR